MPVASTSPPAPRPPVAARPHERPASGRARRVWGIATMREPVSPELYARIALVALGALTLIVLTGAAVRLTDSGLGCPDWPRCYGQAVAPLKSHAIIEYSNRLISGLVGLAAIAAGALAFRRRPFRRDLGILGVLLPLGVVAQAILGGVTVEQRLAPGYVMAHFGLSMLILVAAVTLAWRATHEPGSRPRSNDRKLVWPIRGLAVLGAVTIFAGTVATAAGPHAGGSKGQAIHRLRWHGAGTLDWAIHKHASIAAVFGLCVAACWWLARRRTAAAPGLRRSLTVLVGLLAIQGLLGGVQYGLHLPSEIVWVHVTLAAFTWVVLLWGVASAGRLRAGRPGRAVGAPASAGS